MGRTAGHAPRRIESTPGGIVGDDTVSFGVVCSLHHTSRPSAGATLTAGAGHIHAQGVCAVCSRLILRIQRGGAPRWKLIGRGGGPVPITRAVVSIAGMVTVGGRKRRRSAGGCRSGRIDVSRLPHARLALTG